MELLECLVRTPTEQLGRIAAHTGVDVTGDRRALERELAASLTDRAWLQGLLADLSDDEWAALKVVFFNGGDQGITVELCHQIVNLLSGRRRKSPARAVEELQNRGLIFSRAQNYRQVFFIPTDLMGALGDILSRQMVYRICLEAGASLRVTPPDRDLVEDAHRFLAHVYKTEVTLTQQGQIFKRHLRALLDLLVDETDEDESLVGRYPEPLGLLMGYALDRRLLAREEGRLKATEQLHRWVGESRSEKQADLFAYWQDRYFYQDLQTFLSVMRQVGGSWVSVDRLVLELEPLINPSQRGSFLLRLRHHLATFLGPLGLLEVSELTEEGPGAGPAAEPGAPAAEGPATACRLTRTGMEVLDARGPGLFGTAEAERQKAPDEPGGVVTHHTFLLQATFEILATRPMDGQVLWNLELIGDLVGRTDRTLTYRLSRQSIYRALKSGMTRDGLLTFLREHSAAGLPQNVAFDLAAWADSYGQVYLQAVMLLRCASPILAQQVKASRRTARYVLGELSETDLIIDEARFPELLEALEADGLMPKPTVERPGEIQKQDA